MNCLLWRRRLSIGTQRRRIIEKDREENNWIRKIFFRGKEGGEAKAVKYLEKYCGKDKEQGMKRRKIIIFFHE